MLTICSGNVTLPYSVCLNGTWKRVCDIRFYAEDGVLCSTDRGWLGKDSYSAVHSIDLPVEKVVRRNKEKFDGEVFGIIQKKTWGDSEVVLYIPAEMLHVHEVDMEYRSSPDFRLYRRFEGDGFVIEDMVASLDVRLNEIRAAYSEAREDSKGYCIGTDKVGNAIEKMRVLNIEFAKEKERLNGLTVEEAIAEAGIE